MFEKDIKEVEKILIDNLEAEKMKIPKCLYKYSTLDMIKLDTWLDEKIWFSRADCLNDPFDCTLLYCNDEELKFDWSKDIVSNIQKTCLVYCMSKSPYNNLLWSYYTDNEGICFEYEVKPNDNYYPVIYCPDKINFTAFLNQMALTPDSKELEKLYELGNIGVHGKSDKWKHEEEVRIVIQSSDFCVKENNRGIALPLQSHGLKVSKIILGAKFPLAEKTGIVKILKEKYNCPITIIKSKNNSFDLYDQQNC